MAQTKIGAPGFILMEEMGRDMPGTLAKIGRLGFDGIELLGFFGHGAEDIRRWCGEAGLEPYACFARLAELSGAETPEMQASLSDFDKTLLMPGATPEEKLGYIREIGCKYVGLLLPDDAYDEALIRQFNEVAVKAAAFGLRVQYHNHNKEYLDRWRDGYRMDRIMANTLPEVLFEPDLGWMEIGGCRCIPQLEKYAHRIHIVHLKDYYRESFDTSKEHFFRPTGYGVMDWGELVPFCEERICPRWYTADHDKACDGDVFGELGMSLDFIRSILELC